MASGEFVEVKCDECGNEQIVFNKPAEDVECIVCDAVIAESRGGKAYFHAQVQGMAQ